MYSCIPSLFIPLPKSLKSELSSIKVILKKKKKPYMNAWIISFITSLSSEVNIHSN